MSEHLESHFVKQLKENQNIIHKICKLYTSDNESHNDLFQEITIQLWKAFPKFRGESKFSTWAYRVALNTAITLYRKSTRLIPTTDFEKQSFERRFLFSNKNFLQMNSIFIGATEVNETQFIYGKLYKEGTSESLGWIIKIKNSSFL